MSEPVKELLSTSIEVGREVFFVPTEGFDDIVSRLPLRLLEGDALAKTKEVLSVADKQAKMAFSIPPLPVTSLVKSNAYPLSCPRQALKLDF